MLLKSKSAVSLDKKQNIKGSKKPSKKINRQNLIRKEALKLFSQQGYDRTTLKDIADQLNLTHPAIYYYYKSKSKLLFDAIKISIEGMLAQLLLSLETSPEDPNEQLRNMIEKQVIFQFESQDTFRLIDSVLFGAMSRAGVLQQEETDELQSIQRQIVQLYQHILADGLDKNVFSMSDKTVAKFAILGAVSNVPYWFRDEGELSRGDVAKKMADFVVNSIN
jgi:AcrR family transcriptional regulator